jgi:hypothetical protein
MTDNLSAVEPRLGEGGGEETSERTSNVRERVPEPPTHAEAGSMADERR